MFTVHCPEQTILEAVILLSLPAVPINLMQSGIKIARLGNRLLQTSSSFILYFFPSLALSLLYHSLSPLLSLHLSFCQLVPSFTVPTHLFSPLNTSTDLRSGVDLSPGSQKMPKIQDNKREFISQEHSKGFQAMPTMPDIIIFYCWKRLPSYQKQGYRRNFLKSLRNKCPKSSYYKHQFKENCSIVRVLSRRNKCGL